MKEAWNDYKKYCEVAKEFRHKHKIASVLFNLLIVASLLAYYFVGIIIGKMSA